MYFNKSHFQMGMDCPTKLYYAARPSEYSLPQQDDEFLRSLAEGGFLVGELARQYYPEGQKVGGDDHQSAISSTQQMLSVDETTLFEASFSAEGLFTRSDIIQKQGMRIDLIEVKSKSIDSTESEPFLTKRGKVESTWTPYLFDVAFQKKVIELAMPGCTVIPYLMLVDKSATCTVEGLHQQFRIEEVEGKRRAQYVGSEEDQICRNVLNKVAVGPVLEQLETELGDSRDLLSQIRKLATAFNASEHEFPTLGSKCKNCEFRGKVELDNEGLKSGFHQCWKQVTHWDSSDFDEPIVFDLANFGKKSDQHIGNGIYKLRDLPESELTISDDGQAGLSRSERQKVQLQFAKGRRSGRYLDKNDLKREMESWTFPLNFIDFETVAPSIPLHIGMRPYETIAFQFSHHRVHEDGTVEHVNEYLNRKIGEFPNFEFLRQLKTSLENDQGTVFRYADHENTVLNHIITQLETKSEDVVDSDSLVEFAQTLTNPAKSGRVNSWEPSRPMVDMRKVLSRFYYHPRMGGSESIKYALPAVLNDSEYLRDKYSQPIYGAENQIKSLNFRDHIWVAEQDGQIANPYDLLLADAGQLCSEVEPDRWDSYSGKGGIQDGGAAMTAYLYLQQRGLDEEKRESICNALLRYCELDTLAMVMIYEGWREMVF